ncbi:MULTISPECIES: copper resistance CopC family protein [unclassified Modestobacter]|uniref:copper resistance CopC family protein n=1 Tax=unclassified Modestobacter TaxID=2643866 RepID=UPI0022AAA47B|nr:MULTISPECIES: copper resistance CopC family protein [unclassified Modestobacter]MCZ2825964.1 copper resistance protein CopC [Modestobacter sp. VKM Ac-2981]MCZ2852971.1 copper resistance protein CopC [Modestobacter sp. VKM Ac-2982]
MTVLRALPIAGPRPGPVLLVGLLAVLLLGIGAPPARAHDALVRSSPSAGAAVPTAPSSVELDFSGTPLPLGTEVLVLGPDGAVVSTGAAAIQDTTVVQPLSAGLPAGSYTVQWRSTSSDGHPLTGSWDFTVAAGSTPAPDAAPLSVAAAAADPALPVGWLVGGVLALGAAAALVLGRLRSRR